VLAQSPRCRVLCVVVEMERGPESIHLQQDVVDVTRSEPL